MEIRTIKCTAGNANWIVPILVRKLFQNRAKSGLEGYQMD